MITYVTGDATWPVGDGPKVIAHIVNDEGRWGSGFVLALDKLSPVPRENYKDWHERHVDGWVGAYFELGYVGFARVRGSADPSGSLVVANMIAQRGTGKDPDGRPCIRYGALGRCLKYLGDGCSTSGETIHMPRIGAGLAGGDWNIIERLIIENVCAAGVPVTVYDLPHMAA